MNREQKRFVLEQSIGCTVANTVITTLITWLTMRSLDVIPLWGTQSIGGDTIAGIFIMCFLTCLIVTKIVHALVGKDKVSAYEWKPESHPIVGRMPHHLGKRSAALATVATALVAPLVIGILMSQNITGASVPDFLMVKAVGTAALSAVIAPLIVVRALADQASAMSMEAGEEEKTKRT